MLLPVFHKFVHLTFKVYFLPLHALPEKLTLNLGVINVVLYCLLPFCWNKFNDHVPGALEIFYDIWQIWLIYRIIRDSPVFAKMLNAINNKMQLIILL